MSAKQNPQVLKLTKEGASIAKEQSTRKRQPSGRISAACEACKKRKTKCSGHPPPCQMCEQLDTPCVIDLTLDMRRRTALQRTIEESKGFQDTLSGVINVLRGGDGSDIEGLVRQIQQATDEEELVETLQDKFRGRRESDSLGMDRQMKMEEDEALSFESDDEGGRAEPSKRFFPTGPGTPKKRPLSVQEDSVRRLSTSAIELESVGKRGGRSLASRYLPLISKLRGVSDLEATRILHDFKTSPVKTEGVAALNIHDRRQSRPHLNLHTGQHSQKTSSSESHPPDRTNWHLSLQLTKPELQSPMASSQGQWTDQLSPQIPRQSFEQSYFGLPNSGAMGMALASDRMTHPLAMTASNVSQEVQTHPAIYNPINVHKTKASQVLDIFGDLRALDGSTSRQYRTSHEEFTVQSSATIPVYLVQSRLLVEDSPLCKVFTGFRDAARQMVATGTPAGDIINGSEVVLDLFFRDRWPTDGFTCSSWACELCRSFGEVGDFVRIGCIFLLTRLMRWMICPSSETYAEIPECQRPTPTQCFIPHLPAIDLHPMPAMRDLLCHNLQDWVTPMVQTGVSCNWPFTMEEVLETDAATGSVRVSKIFGEHVSKSDNWSFNSYAFTLYPELVGKVRVEDG